MLSHLMLPTGSTVSSIKKLLLTKKPMILWDIHGTLAQVDIKEHNQVYNKYQYLFSPAHINQIITENPKFAADWAAIPVNSSAEIYGDVAKKHGYQEETCALYELGDTYYPMPDIEHVVRSLADQNIIQRIGSNIGIHQLEKLKKRFIAQKSLLFSLIKEGKIAHTCSSDTSSQHAISQCEYSKPDPRFFTAFNDTYNKTGSYLTILIDDKKENIDAALKIPNFIGILFLNATQVYQDLQIVGVLPYP